jgi:small subunit ribosomal protein S15
MNQIFLNQTHSFSKYKKTNVGSTESQIHFLSEKVIQLTLHLQTHKKDYSTQRGLKTILGKRKRLLLYLLKQNVDTYNSLKNVLNI